MNNILTRSKLLLAGLLLAGTFVACSDGSDSSVLPEFGGKIKFDRTRIGENQMLTASYVIPTGGSNIEAGTIFWNCDEYQILSTATEKEGVSTIRFAAPEVGVHEIEFVRQYINFEQSESQNKSIKGNFTVIPCDVLTSFWGDSKAVVLATANETFEGDRETFLTAIIKNLLGNKTESHQYYFANDKLNKITRTLFLSASVGKAVHLVNRQALNLEKKGFTRVSFEESDVTTGTKKSIDLTKLEDKAYTDPISTNVENGNSKLLVVLQNSKTIVHMSYGKVQGAVLNEIVYQSR